MKFNTMKKIIIIILGLVVLWFIFAKPEKEDPALENLQEAKKSEVIELADGDTLNLEAQIVKQKVGNRTIKRLAYNGQIPGPIIKVQKDATITVNLKNSIDVETTLHSHGLRLDNAFDGVPDVTQDPIGIGETFSYTLNFPDEGVYWYHPHIREDYTQELGLYGNFIVEGEENYWNDAAQEEYLIFDDILEDGEFNPEVVTHTLMGRFGDTLLINDQQDFNLEVKTGQIARLFITNVANTRVFDLEFEGTDMKLVGGDVGRIEQEEFVDDVIIAPAERYIIEVMYEKEGSYPIIHREEKVGTVTVTDSEKISQNVTFMELRNNSQDYDLVRKDFSQFITRAPDKSARLNIDMKGMMMGGSMNMNGGNSMMTDDDSMMNGMDDDAIREHCKVMPGMQGCEKYNDTTNGMMQSLLTPQIAYAHHDTVEEPEEKNNSMMMDQMVTENVEHTPDGIEWEDEMAMMNRMSSDESIEWQIIDQDTGDVNMDIDWSFNQGDLVKIQIFNDPESMHPMQHPIHFHGQRFVVLTRDGEVNENLQWKDTTLIRTGETVDILVEMSNPGIWMSHCHIAEHLHAGMMFSFNVN